jgi:hypothetical protein
MIGCTWHCNQHEVQYLTQNTVGKPNASFFIKITIVAVPQCYKSRISRMVFSAHPLLNGSPSLRHLDESEVVRLPIIFFYLNPAIHPNFQRFHCHSLTQSKWFCLEVQWFWFNFHFFELTFVTKTLVLNFNSQKCIKQWIGLRENLQETLVFTIKYRAFL